MREWDAALLFLNYGPDFTYIGGRILWGQSLLSLQAATLGDFCVRCEDMVPAGMERATAMTIFSHEPNFLS